MLVSIISLLELFTKNITNHLSKILINIPIKSELLSL